MVERETFGYVLMNHNFVRLYFRLYFYTTGLLISLSHSCLSRGKPVYICIKMASVRK